jgi:hypothetical protein
MRYKDATWAATRLVDTYVFHDGKVRHVTSYNRGKFNLFSEGEEIKLGVEEIDVSSPPLGYCNTGRSCAYVYRKTLRRDYRQGLRRSNIEVSRFYDDNGTSVDFSMFDLTHTIRNEYPSFKHCFDYTEEEGVAQAFSRDFCVNIKGEIIYRFSSKIGKSSDGSTIEIYPNFKILSESLTEVTENVQIF